MSTTTATDGLSEELAQECPKPLVEALDALTSEVSALREQVKQQENEIEDLQSKVSEQKEKLAEYQDYSGREFADVRGRITELENQEIERTPESDTPRVDEGETGSQNVQTPLERICAIPEHLAKRELSVNQERARFVAKGISDYAEKAPAGLVIDSRTIKRVITASEEKRPHTQTVARVIDFLDDLGKDDVQQKKRRGRKLIVVDRKLADRLANHGRGDRGTNPAPTNAVISGS